MTPIHDLRSFIEALDAAGMLARIKARVSLDRELANVAAALSRQSGGAALFENVANSAWPIFVGGLSMQAGVALALGCQPAEVSDAIGRALEPAQGISPRGTAEAGWKKHVLTGDAIDIRQLPIPIHGAHDGGAFITAGVTVARDPVSGRGNLSYNRMMVLGPHTFGFNVNAWRHVMQFYEARQAQDQPLPLAIAIGLDPAIMIAAGARYDDDELRIAGALRGEGVPVSRGQTVDLDIPSEAEIVIEGYLPPHTRHAEGPLAEFHGYYGEAWDSPTFEVSAICTRERPIYQTIVPGWAEHIYLGNVLTREPLLLRFVRHVSANVAGLHIPPYGNGFSVLIQIQKTHPGEPRNVALAAFTAHVNIKQAIVVDPDVNLYDPADVLWAITNRVDWSRDVFFVPGAQGHEMDPTADARGVHTKIGIDATYKPERRAYGPRVAYPPVDLGPYLSS
jgi:2,5-furandicarboxylate decarboxylase 1